MAPDKDNDTPLVEVTDAEYKRLGELSDYDLALLLRRKDAAEQMLELIQEHVNEQSAVYAKVQELIERPPAPSERLKAAFRRLTSQP